MLIVLLWRQNESGSVAELAKRAGVGFASAYRELHAMRRLGLVTSERRSGAESFCANAAHPLAGALRALVVSPTEPLRDDETDRTRGELRALGAPLLGEPTETVQRPVEEAIVRGVALAHRDPAVARALPICLFKSKDRLDGARLREFARRLGEKQAVGFFLDLTSELSGDARWADWSRPLRDRRRKVANDFFHGTTASRRQRRLAEERSPDVARRWGFRMNMDIESFRSLFERFVHAA
jgi:hypothetical protein